VTSRRPSKRNRNLWGGSGGNASSGLERGVVLILDWRAQLPSPQLDVAIHAHTGGMCPLGGSLVGYPDALGGA